MTLLVVFLAVRASRIEGIPLVKECEALALCEALFWAMSFGF